MNTKIYWGCVVDPNRHFPEKFNTIPKNFEPKMNFCWVISFLFHGLTTLFDILLYPVYYAWYQPWKELRERRTPRTTIEFTSKNEVVVKSLTKNLWQTLSEEDRANKPFVENVYDLFKLSSNEHAEKLCSGIRKKLEEVIEPDTNNIAAHKFLMEDVYRWYSYKSIQKRIDNVSHGLISGTSLKSKDVVVVYADTCLEWFISAMACFRINCVIATIYTYLGPDGVRYCINKVQPKLIITNQHLLPNLLDVLRKESIKDLELIYFPNSLYPDTADGMRGDSWVLHNFDDIEKFGEDSDETNHAWQWQAAKRDDIAMIMFTSGSTGTPKGVVFCHDNIIEGVYGLAAPTSEDMGYTDLSNETHIAYLPLAHIFELMLELMSYCSGIRVAYSSPFTLTDKSPKIAKGQKGDIAIVQPTFMIAVPTVLSRVYKNIRSAIENKNPYFAQLFNLSFEYKRYWRERGMDTPLLNMLLFKKMADVLGGKLRVIYSGGGPMSNDVYQFFRLVMCPATNTCYGLTESCGVGIANNKIYSKLFPRDGVVLKLESLTEEGYLVNDKNENKGFKDDDIDNQLPIISPYWIKNENIKDDNDDSNKIQNCIGTGIRATWLGHATVLAEVDGLNVLCDPVFSKYCGCDNIPKRLVDMITYQFKRYRDPPCSVSQLPHDIHAVVISHTHYDHLDETSVAEVNERYGESIHWYVPKGSGSFFVYHGIQKDNLHEMVWWEEAEINGSKLIFTPSNHYSNRGVLDMNVALWGSFAVIGKKGHRFWFGGDTAYCDVFKQIGQKIGPFHLSTIPIGAYAPREALKWNHVDPEQAIQIHYDIRSEISLGIHWGTFMLGATESYLEPKEIIDEKRKEHGKDEDGKDKLKFYTTSVGGSQEGNKSVINETS